MALPPKTLSAADTQALSRALAAQSQLGPQGAQLMQHSDLLQALLADDQKQGQAITGGPLELGLRLAGTAIAKRGLDASNRNILNAAANQQHSQAATDLQALGQTPDAYTPLPTNYSAWGGGGPPQSAADHPHAVTSDSGSVPLMIAPNSTFPSREQASGNAGSSTGSPDYSGLTKALMTSGDGPALPSPDAHPTDLLMADALGGKPMGTSAAQLKAPTAQGQMQMQGAPQLQALPAPQQVTPPSDPLGGGTPSLIAPPATGAPPTDDPTARAYSFFRNAGLSHGAASGVVGSLQAESGLNPLAWNPKEGAFGIGQWRQGRLAALQSFARARGTQPGDLETQLEFMGTELGGPERASAAMLHAVDDPQSGAAAMNHYLRPAGFRLGGDPRAVSQWDKRAGNSMRVASLFGGQGGDVVQPQAGGAVGGGSAPALPPSGPMPPGASNQLPPPADPLGQTQPAPMQAPGPAGPQANPVGATPQQIQLLRQMQSSPDPSVRQQAHEYAMTLRMQGAPAPAWEPHVDQTTGRTLYVDKNNPGAAPIQAGAPRGYVAPAPAKMTYDDRSRTYVPQVGTEQSAPVKLSPSAFGTRDAFGNWTVSNVPGRAGEAPAGKQFNPQTGGYDFIPGAEPHTTGTFQPGSVVTYDASNRPTVTQAPAYSAGDYLSQREKFLNSDDYKQHINTTNALNSLQRAMASATSNNGLLDMAAIDNLVRAQTGLSARQGNVQLLLGHLGVPQEVMGQISNTLGTGPVTPESLRNAISVLRAYTDTHQVTAQHRLDEENAIAQRYGYKDLGVTLPRVEPMPDVPWMRPPPPPQQGAAQPASFNPMRGGGGGQTPAAPPPGQRQPGQVYMTPKGPLRYTGRGWAKP